jgi:hypothetical protein
MENISKFFSVAAIYLLLSSTVTFFGCNEDNTVEPPEEEYEIVVAPPRVAIMGSTTGIDEMEMNDEMTLEFYIHAPGGIKSASSILYYDLSSGNEILPISVPSNEATELYTSVTFSAQRKLKGVGVKVVDSQGQSKEAIFPIRRVTGAPLDIFMENDISSVIGVFNKYFYMSGEVIAVNGLSKFFYTPYVKGVAQDPVNLPIGADSQKVPFTIKHRVVEGLEKLEITIIDEKGDGIGQTITVLSSDNPNVTFVPAEKQVLEDNGITVFTSSAVSSVTQIAYPFHTRSLQDLYYFSNLSVIDFTNGSIISGKNKMPTRTFTYRYGVPAETFTNNGGFWQPYLTLCDKIPLPSKVILADMLEEGMITKIYYIPQSMDLDDILEPYVASGIVELVTPESYPKLFPDDAPIDFASWLTTNVYSTDYCADVTYPARDYVNYNVIGSVVLDTRTIYKVTLQGREGGLGFELPKEYRFNKDIYKYLKFKVFTATPTEVFMASINNVPINRYLNSMIRIGNTMYGYEANSIHGGQQGMIDGSGQGDNAALKIDMNNLTTWTDFSRIMRTGTSGMGPDWQRMILIQPGTGNGPPPADFDAININGVVGLKDRLIYYFADVRVSKNP